MKKITVITNSLIDSEVGKAQSNAGADVQRSIVEAALSLDDFLVNLIDFNQTGEVRFSFSKEISKISYKVNSYFRRFSPFIFLKLIARLIEVKPDYVLIYNLYFQQYLAVAIYKMISGKKAVAIIQDYRKGEVFNKRQIFSDAITLKLTRFFNFCIPITSALSKEIPLPEKYKYVYSGGKSVASESRVFEDSHTVQLKNEAIFAGHLDRYNGIDILVNHWIERSIECKLVIYGSGPLEGYIRESASKCNRIEFKGKVPHSVILAHLQSSKFNFCLRYSRGLHAEYFYPSKFFLGANSRSLMIYNHFPGLLDSFVVDEKFVLGSDIQTLAELVDGCSDAEIEALSRKQRELYKSCDSIGRVLAKVIKYLDQGEAIGNE